MEGEKKGRCWCSRCTCILCVFLLVIILSLPLPAFYLFSVSKPRVPFYALHDLQLISLGSRPLETEFRATIKADNPNAHIGFIYGEESSVGVFYQGTQVCTGKLPHFHQGPRNVTMMKVDLVGEPWFGSSGLQEAYGNGIPLVVKVKVKVPVRIVVWEYRLRELKVFVNCNVVVGDLAPDNKINVVSSNMTFQYKL